MRHQKMIIGFSLLLVLSFLAACQPRQITKPAPAAVESQASSFDDPFAYCTAKGTLDLPGSDYTGAKVPESLVTGFIKATELKVTEPPSDAFKESLTWRCMDGKVMVCSAGANLQCGAKPETTANPSQAITDYCKQTPDAEFIPLVVVGHESIFTWSCVKGTPTARQTGEVDAQGFMKEIWYTVEK